MYMPNDCLMGGEETTGGNWSAHCISTWQWITVCFIVCVRHLFVRPSIRPFGLPRFVGGQKQRKKADRSETLTRARTARHTALPPQTQRRRLSHLQLHARPGVSFFLTFFAMASLSALPFTLGHSKSSQTIGFPSPARRNRPDVQSQHPGAGNMMQGPGGPPQHGYPPPGPPPQGGMQYK